MIFRELDRPAVLRAIRTILQDPDHKHFPQVLKLVMEQALGKPASNHYSAEPSSLVGVVALPPMRSTDARFPDTSENRLAPPVTRL